MSRVCLLGVDGPPEPLPSWAARLQEQLAAAGHQVVYLTPPAPGLSALGALGYVLAGVEQVDVVVVHGDTIPRAAEVVIEWLSRQSPRPLLVGIGHYGFGMWLFRRCDVVVSRVEDVVPAIRGELDG